MAARPSRAKQPSLAEQLLGVVTDGDLRRAPLRGYGLDATADLIMNTNFFYTLFNLLRF